MVGKGTRPINILLIEDNPGDVQLVKMYLKDASFKYDFFVTETLFEGLNLLKREEIDLVLLDLSLTDSQGFKTLSKYLEQAPHVPVVVLTGINNEIVGNQSVKAGAQDFLVKGQFDGRLLGRVIRYSLQRFKDKQKIEDDRRELTLNERRTAKVQQLAGFGNWEMDLISHEMVWTEEVFRIFGVPLTSPATGLSDYLRCVHHDDRRTVESFFDNATKTESLHKIEHRIIVEGITIKWIALHAQTFFEDLTEKVLLVGGVQDITERKLSEMMIIEQNMTRQNNLLKEQVLSDLGFHIRTPLTSIVNLLYLIENTNLSQSHRELVDGLKYSVDDLSLMVNNLLNFSMLVAQNLQVDEEVFEISNFWAAAEKVLHIKADGAKVRLEIENNIESDTKIKADSKKIAQIIYNCMDYAVRSAPKSGGVRFEVSMNTKESRQTQAEGWRAVPFRLRVTHTGRGLSRASLLEMMSENRILENIGTHYDPNDANIGLAIVAKLVNILGGSINLDSTRFGVDNNELIGFEIVIPLKADVTAYDGSVMPPQVPVRILLVEDHFLHQMATRKLLKAWSPLIEVDIAENGLVALEKCRQNDYDLVLMDLQMPMMNGFDATVRLRNSEKLTNLPIIAVTASANKQEAERCLEIGMNDYVSKPFKPEELYAVVDKWNQVATKNRQIG